MKQFNSPRVDQMRHRISVALSILVLFLSSVSAFGQETKSGDFEIPSISQNTFPPLGGEIGSFGPPSGAGKHVFFGGSISIEEGTNRGTLSVVADIEEGWHIYSMEQLEPLLKSRVIIPEGLFAEVGEFVADSDPHVHKVDYYEVPLLEFSGKVTFTAQVELASGVDPATTNFDVKFDGQVCSDKTCFDIPREPVPVKFVGYTKAAESQADGYRDEDTHARMEIWIEPKTVRPGGKAKLFIKATTLDHYHIYALEQFDPELISKPTLVVLSKRNKFTASFPTTSSVPTSEEILPDEPPVRYHDGEVVWTIDLQAPSDIPGEYTFNGLVGYQTCEENRCDAPAGLRFQVPITVGAEEIPGKSLASITVAEYADAAKHQQLTTWYAQEFESIDMATLFQFIGFGLLGGLILNLMPCVLPVIGLKILSFAEQAGHSYGRVLSLNLWFSAGLLLVFMILATLASFLGLGWGEQFTSLWFKVHMTCFVFAMALSFLGIWELPIPGFAGRGSASKLQEQEGIGGAFFKGIFTTLLATPCSGPFLGPVFALTLKQPPSVIYVLFASVGVGMASPYILVGIFPSLIRWLPKPGAWMDTFKQLMGFVLLATVVFLFSTVQAEYFLATLAAILGVGFCCWYIARVEYSATLNTKIRTWAVAIAIYAFVVFGSFKYLGPQEELIHWKPYAPTELAQLQSEGKTVMVDFTAAWCLTCKWNLKFAINTERIKAIVEENGVEPLLADWTSRDDVIKKALAELDSASIPLLAIYPADDPENVIILRDQISEAQLLKALQLAGPSKSIEAAAEDPTATAAVAPVAPANPVR